MVCDRCISTVKSILTGMGIRIVDIRLGEAVVEDGEFSLARLDMQLKEVGFELIKDQNVRLTE